MKGLIVLQTCSSDMQRGLLWLQSFVENTEDIWDCDHVIYFSALSLIDKFVLERYKLAAKSDDFWPEYGDGALTDDNHLFYYLHQLGLSKFEPFKILFDDYVLDMQTVSGRISVHNDYHSGALRALIAKDPSAEATIKALNYFLANWESFDLEGIAVGMLALEELDFYRYLSFLNSMAKHLAHNQEADGSFKELDPTLYAIEAMSRISGFEDEVNKAVKYVKEIQKDDGSWGVKNYHINSNAEITARAILALNAAGEGPKVSLYKADWEKRLTNQYIQTLKPHFIHTSPLYQGSLLVKEIHKKVYEMIHRASKEIRISSLYIDMFYEEIIELAELKNIEFKIITRPKSGIKGMRHKIAQNVIDLLNTFTKGNVRTNDIIHSRLIIVDDKEVLVSSADLTRDQLFDEFNSGIWTNSSDVISEAIKYYDNVWDLSDNL